MIWHNHHGRARSLLTTIVTNRGEARFLAVTPAPTQSIAVLGTITRLLRSPHRVASGMSNQAVCQDSDFEVRHVVSRREPPTARKFVAGIEKLSIDHRARLVLVIEARAEGNDCKPVINLRVRHAGRRENTRAN